jgi:hypothetical protein
VAAVKVTENETASRRMNMRRREAGAGFGRRPGFGHRPVFPYRPDPQPQQIHAAPANESVRRGRVGGRVSGLAGKLGQ